MDEMNPNVTPPPSAATTEKQSNMWGMLCHLSALAVCIPFANIIGPLIVWMIKKQEFPFVDDQGKESLNFQITVTIICLIAMPLMFISSFIGRPILLLISLADIVMVIMAAIKANNGEAYRYPFALRLIK